MTPSTFEASLEFARELDGHDPLAGYRDQFHIPVRPSGEPMRYLCGNSLGLQPKGVRTRIEQELQDWANLAVRGHQRAAHPWYSVHEEFSGPLARLVGAQENEVVLMNSLTLNLHVLMTTFYRPTQERYKILMEAPAFPSDTYAMQTQMKLHGFDPAEGLITVGPRNGKGYVEEADVEAAIEEHGRELAVVMLGGINFLSGQFFDMKRITRAGHAVGAYVGFDLAHAAGNVPMRLHDWNVDFAAWCTYKYMNGGSGAMAGAYLHERHVTDPSLPRMGGWWGNDPKTRFRLHLEREFIPVLKADAWQISNPSVFALAPVAASLELFDQVGMEALRTKSLQLTGFLEYLLKERASHVVSITTPEEPERRGCQLSIRMEEGARDTEAVLEEKGFIVDFREPDILRVAPTPFYNTFEDAWMFVEAVSSLA